MRGIVMIGVIGLGGVGVLMALGFWQVDRLAQKEAFLALIEARIGDAPVDMPGVPDPVADKFAPVVVSGVIEPDVIRVLVSRKSFGAGHRLIVPIVLAGGRRVLVDLGFLGQGRPMPDFPRGVVTITGNLHWPEESDGFTPAPDSAARLWFARDVDSMAGALATAPVLIVLRDGISIGGVTAWPVDTHGIPNDHRGYAITWFSLAAIWLVMTGFLVYRMRKPE